MIVPFPAGSATDGQARLIGAHFQKVFGHGFIVENMPGATGAIAARTIAKAAPDGYTLMLSSVSTHSANAYLYNNLGYDPITRLHARRADRARAERHGGARGDAVSAR